MSTNPKNPNPKLSRSESVPSDDLPDSPVDPVDPNDPALLKHTPRRNWRKTRLVHDAIAYYIRNNVSNLHKTDALLLRQFQAEIEEKAFAPMPPRVTADGEPDPSNPNDPPPDVPPNPDTPPDSGDGH